jgi:hypothetical protein
MVKAVSVVKGRRVSEQFPEVTTSKDLVLQLALELHTSKETLFLMNEAGEILVNEQAVAGRCFLHHREEVFLEDKDLAPIGNWKGFKRYPWRLVCGRFDYSTITTSRGNITLLFLLLKISCLTAKRLVKCIKRSIRHS